MTINLSGIVLNHQDHEARTQIVVEAINALQPDAVSLQEVSATDDVAFRGDVIADATGYELTWSQASDFVYYWEGPAVMTRWPILDTVSADLPHSEAFGLTTRQVVGALIDLDGRSWPVFSAHTTVEGDDEEKADQMVEILETMASFEGSVPATLGGDLNATPGTLAIQTMLGAAEHDGVTGDLIDGWATANPGEDGFTSTAYAPTKRIDYIMTEPAKGLSVSCELLFDEPEDEIYASDHLGVLCEYEVVVEGSAGE